MSARTTNGRTPPRMLLVGEVRTAEHALRGLLSAGVTPTALVTTDIAAVQARSGMSRDYYTDLVALGEEHGVEARVIERLDDEVAWLRAQSPDYIWILGWPYIVRTPVLDVAPCIGMHPTRLPKRRGGAPLNWTILDDERSSAVSLIRLRPGLDDGELLAQGEFEIGPDEYVGDILQRVWCITERLVAQSARALADGRAQWRAQDDRDATYTRRRRPEDGRIRWDDSAQRIRNLVRATSEPFPGAWTMLDGAPLRIWRAAVPTGYRAPLKAAPGTLLETADDGVIIGTRDNALLIQAAQLGDAPPVGGSALADLLRPRLGATLD